MQVQRQPAFAGTSHDEIEYAVLEQRAAMSISASSNRGPSICSRACSAMIPKSVVVNASALLVGRNSWREGAPCDAKLHGRAPHKIRGSCLKALPDLQIHACRLIERES